MNTYEDDTDLELRRLMNEELDAKNITVSEDLIRRTMEAVNQDREERDEQDIETVTRKHKKTGVIRWAWSLGTVAAAVVVVIVAVHMHNIGGGDMLLLDNMENMPMTGDFSMTGTPGPQIAATKDASADDMYDTDMIMSENNGELMENALTSNNTNFDIAISNLSMNFSSLGSGLYYNYEPADGSDDGEVPTGGDMTGGDMTGGDTSGGGAPTGGENKIDMASAPADSELEFKKELSTTCNEYSGADMPVTYAGSAIYNIMFYYSDSSLTYYEIGDAFTNVYSIDANGVLLQTLVYYKNDDEWTEYVQKWTESAGYLAIETN